MKRSFSKREGLVLGAGLALIAATYGLVRLAFGLYLPDVQRDLGLAGDVAGWVSSGASVVYCVGAGVGFLVAARVPRLLVAVAALVAGGGALGMAAAGGPGVFAVAAVVGSAGAGLASPALVRIVAGTVPERSRERAQAVVNAGTGPGLVVAGALALVLLPDWRSAWAWSGVFALVVGAVLLIATRRPRPERAGPSGSAIDADWWRRHGLVLALALLFGAGSAVVWTYGRSALVDAGAPVAVSVSAWIALGVGGAAVVPTARWTSRLRARTAWTVTAAAVAGAVVLLGTAPGSTVVALLACAVFGWGYTAATGALIAWTTEIAAERAASGTSVLFVALVAGQAVGSAGAGVLVEGPGTTTAFLAGAVVTAASAVGAWADRTAGVRQHRVLR